MRQRILVLILLGLFITQILAGCTLFSDDDEYGEGFKETDLVAPKVPSYAPHDTIERPDVNESQLAPGYSYNLSWAMGEVYANWGGFISISCENTGVNDIFVYRAGIVVNWSFPSTWIYEERNVLIPTGEIGHLGLVYFDAPNVTGDYGYHIILSLLVKDNELFSEHNVESWYDNGTVHSKDKSFYVHSLEPAREIKYVYNYKHYQDKLNSKIDFNDVNVQNNAQEIIEKYPGDYNIYQVLAIFDFMLNDLTYISDPEGRDYWASCSETLKKKGGDCEDLSILFSSMIGAIGGTTRIYLTKTHAFPAIYIGNLVQKNEILDAIRLYYGTEPDFVLFGGEGHYWLAADPAGSLYLGGLPADAEPALISESPLSLDFIFIDTKEIHVIDILG
ncbi:MAG: hypothetical protein JSV09_02240 [Thermoplasmata archaeon]|nr:MAG: hypothetical protein JSV09_02240 [Thermoplasmata archaeon]